MASARRTTDHDEIRRWVEARGGHPAAVASTRRNKRRGALLRVDFPGFSGEGSLEEITWEEFFRIFEGNELEFLFQDESDSRFNKLVSRKQEKAA